MKVTSQTHCLGCNRRSKAALCNACHNRIKARNVPNQLAVVRDFEVSRGSRSVRLHETKDGKVNVLIEVGGELHDKYFSFKEFLDIMMKARER